MYPSALSKPSGFANQPRDFHWLEKNIPCQAACPAQTDIPGYLAAIARGDYDEAYRINLSDNVFPAVLGRVCARPCEPPCRHGWEGLGESVAICFSKRSAADFQSNTRPVVLPSIFPPSGKKVVVIGAGVAGLTTARNLALYGHDVTVYEKHKAPGGMLNQGIPDFRLPRDFIRREIQQIEQTGVKIICGVAIGRDFLFSKLVEENDAVVMAAGTLRPNRLQLPGEELRGVEHGLPFLLQTNEFERREIGERVIVIGGGFTAIDCARTSLRLGARSVKIFYRRSLKEMLVTPGEVEEMEEEGAHMEFLVAPQGFAGEAEHVTGARFVRTRLGDPDHHGRRRPVDIPGSEFVEPADTVLMATGQFPDTGWLACPYRATLVDADQWLKSGKSQRTSAARIFVAGDFATGASTLIEAIGHAKECARQVDTFLMGGERLVDAIRIEDGRSQPRARALDDIPRQSMPVLSIPERRLGAEVEQGFAPEVAIQEAQRCYLCHYKYEIDMNRCIYCDQCVEVKPREKCIVKVTDLVTDEQDRVTGWKPAEFVLNRPTEHFYYINQEDCIRCNACLEVCPVNCISVQKVSRCSIPKNDIPAKSQQDTV